jgi:hypothetical protein
VCRTRSDSEKDGKTPLAVTLAVTLARILEHHTRGLTAIGSPRIVSRDA